MMHERASFIRRLRPGGKKRLIGAVSAFAASAVCLSSLVLPVFADDTAMPDVLVIEAEDMTVINDLADAKNGYLTMTKGVHSPGTAFETPETYTIPAGAYKGALYVRVNSTPTENRLGVFDILSGGASHNGASVDYSAGVSMGEFDRIEFTFTLASELAGAKLRFYNQASASIDIDRMEIYKSGVFYHKLEAESLGGQLTTQTGEDGSVLTGNIPNVGKRVDKTYSGGGSLVTYGWGGSLAAGSYKMVLRIKVLEKTANANATFLSASIMTKKDGANVQIPAVSIVENAFPQTGRFYTVVIPFELPEARTNVEPYLWKQAAPATYLVESVSFMDARFPGAIQTENPRVITIEAEDCKIGTNVGTLHEDYLHIDRAANDAGYIEDKTRYTLPAGTYRVNLYVRLLEEASADQLFVFDAVAKVGGAANETGVGGHGVSAAKFKRNGAFEVYQFSFTAADVWNNARFRLNSRDNAVMDFDRMEIYSSDVLCARGDAGSSGMGTTLATETSAGIVKTGKIAGVGVRVDKTTTQAKKQAVYGNLGNFPRGTYKAVVRMMLIEKTGNPDNVVATFSGNSAQGQFENAPAHSIRESDFPELDTFYDIIIPFTLTSARTNVELYVWNIGPASDGAPNANATTYLIDSVALADAAFPLSLITGVSDIDDPGPPTLALPAGVFGQNAIDIAGPGGTAGASRVTCDPAVNSAGVAALSSTFPVTAGTYRVSVFAALLSAGSSGNAFEVELVDGGGNPIAGAKKTVAAADLTTQTKPVMLSFEIASVGNAGVRINNLGTVGFTLSQIQAYKAANGGVVHFGAKDDTHPNTGINRVENDDGTVTSPSPASPSAGHTVITDGLFNLAPGRNLILFKMKKNAQEASTGNLTNIDFAGTKASSGSGRFQLKTVTTTMLEEIGEWVVVRAEYNADEWITGVQIAMYNYGIVAWDLEYIEALDQAAADEYLASLPPTPIFNIKSQNTAGSNLGFRTPTGMLLTEGMGSGHAIYGTAAVNLGPGDYRAVLMMKIYEKTGDDSRQVGVLDLYGNLDGSSSRTSPFTLTITEGDFAQAGVYYAIVLPFTVGQSFVNVELRFNYSNKVNTMISRHMILQEGIDTPAPVQIPDATFERPDGVEAVAEKDIPLTQENILFTSAKSGRINNGRVEFRTALDNNGGIKGLDEKFYLTSGQKVIRVYLRTPGATSTSTYAFARFALIAGYFPVSVFNITAQTLAGYQNRSYVYETTFTADENTPMDINMVWSGNYDLIIDKIVIKDDDSPDAAEHKLKAAERDGAAVLTVDAAAVGNMSAIDYLTSDLGGVAFRMAATEIIEWLEGADRVEISLDPPDTAKAADLRKMAAQYRYKVEELKVFAVSIKVWRGGQAEEITKLSNPFSLTFGCADELFGRAGGQYLMGFCNYLGQSSRPGALGSSVDLQTKKLTFTSTAPGTFYAGVTDLYELMAPDGTDNPINQPDPAGPSDSDDPGKNPDTGRAGIAAFGMLAALSGAALVFARKKRKSLS